MMRHPEWLCGLGLFGLLTCSEPDVLRRPVAEPVITEMPRSPSPLPAIAVPTGDPAIERDVSTPDGEAP